MAPNIKSFTIDPNGDIYVIVKDPEWEMSQLRDLLGMPQAASLTTIAVERKDTVPEEPDEFHLLVSSRQVLLVSPYFENIFNGSFREAVVDPITGKFHVSANDWNPAVLMLAVNMVHLKIKNIPNNLRLATLVNLMVLTDYCDMESALTTVAYKYVSRLPAKDRPKYYGKE